MMKLDELIKWYEKELFYIWQHNHKEDETREIFKADIQAYCLQRWLHEKGYRGGSMSRHEKMLGVAEGAEDNFLKGRQVEIAELLPKIQAKDKRIAELEEDKRKILKECLSWVKASGDLQAQLDRVTVEGITEVIQRGLWISIPDEPVRLKLATAIYDMIKGKQPTRE